MNQIVKPSQYISPNVVHLLTTSARGCEYKLVFAVTHRSRNCNVSWYSDGHVACHHHGIRTKISNFRIIGRRCVHIQILLESIYLNEMESLNSH